MPTTDFKGKLLVGFNAITMDKVSLNVLKYNKVNTRNVHMYYFSLCLAVTISKKLALGLLAATLLFFPLAEGFVAASSSALTIPSGPSKFIVSPSFKLPLGGKSNLDGVFGAELERSCNADTASKSAPAIKRLLPPSVGPERAPYPRLCRGVLGVIAASLVGEGYLVGEAGGFFVLDGVSTVPPGLLLSDKKKSNIPGVSTLPGVANCCTGVPRVKEMAEVG